MYELDLRALSVRESEQVEWKENVADPEQVAATLSAFANDWANLGGGYVVCGAAEDKDEHGFPSLRIVGLSSARFKEVEGKVLAACRDRVSPSIAPVVQEVPTEYPERRVLVFVMPATKTAHLFRTGEDTGRHYVRISRETREARNGILRELLVRKGVIEEWDRRPNLAATINDLDLIAFRDALQKMGVFDPARGLDEYISDTVQLSPFVPPLCFREPLTNTLRPRNFALLLFGRKDKVQSYISGAFTHFSIYPGDDRSEPYAERSEIPGSLVDQARRLFELLDVQSYVAFDKTDRAAPNALKYPPRALHEAMVNALAHRDYEMVDPTRITVFSNRIEIVSPGSLPTGVSADEFRTGHAPPKWRNQSLAWFLNRLQLAQAEGQGIPTILRSMREEGCPPPEFDSNESRLICLLPAHPRHALAKEHRGIEEAISLGQFERAGVAVATLLATDPTNFRSIQLFAEIHGALGARRPVSEFVKQHRDELSLLPSSALSQLANVLISSEASQEDISLARELYLAASRGRITEQEVGNIAIGLTKAGEEREAIHFLDSQMLQYSALRSNPWILRIRGNAIIGLAKQCSVTGKTTKLPQQTRQRAWEDCRRFIKAAEHDLRHAMSLSPDPALAGQIQNHLEFLEKLKVVATPPKQRSGKGGNKSSSILPGSPITEPIQQNAKGSRTESDGSSNRRTDSQKRGSSRVPSSREGSSDDRPIQSSSGGTRLTGVVATFDDTKGYGFIKPDVGGEDLFAHFRDLEMDGRKVLRVGQRVEFDSADGAKGRYATRIRLLK